MSQSDTSEDDERPTVKCLTVTTERQALTEEGNADGWLSAREGDFVSVDERR